MDAIERLTCIPRCDGEPCPNRGDARRSIPVSAGNQLPLNQNHSLGRVAGNTGRYANVSNSRNPPDVTIIGKHIMEFVAGKTAALEEYVTGLVGAFSSRPSENNGTFYRGVACSTPVNGQRIGPSPKSGSGRYNELGERCIYLIDDVMFLPSEIKASCILVQEYKIPLSELRIADVSSGNQDIDNSLAIIFQYTERGRTDMTPVFDFESELRATGRSEYLLSQSVARIFKKYGWQGLYVPGVHGKLPNIYRNLALFGDCLDAWEKWTTGDYRSYQCWPEPAMRCKIEGCRSSRS
jgi:hypothetical protein